MKRIPREIITFLEKQNFVFVTTTSKSGISNTVPKGIVVIEPKGKIYIINLYDGRTWRNLRVNKHITLCCLNERHFRGYQLKGVATVHRLTKAHDDYVALWRKKVSARITHRLIENVRFEKKTHHHEAYFPPPRSLIEVDVREIISLTEQE